MGLITKIDPEEYKQKLTEAELTKMAYIERELSPTKDPVKLGDEQFIISFDMTDNIEFSKFQQDYREILKTNPKITFEELLQGEDNLVKKILVFLHIDVPIEKITFKQFKYLMWTITKQYVFTSGEDSEYINQITPFFFV